jgi:metal-responsive CopG/Arc/MetJ family transcriptional regulator
MARFSFSIPDDVAELLDRDVERTGNSRSSLIAEYIEQYYRGKSQFAESKDIVQRVKNEHEKAVQRIISDHDAEVQQIRTECEKQVQHLNTDNATSVQQFESELEQLETITKKLSNDLKASEERNASAVDKLRQSEASKNTVVTGLQHENELLQQKVANLETLLQTEKGLNADLRRDKESIQKQLELVTLRLPAPKVGFWARLFGGGRKKEE